MATATGTVAIPDPGARQAGAPGRSIRTATATAISMTTPTDTPMARPAASGWRSG